MDARPQGKTIVLLFAIAVGMFAFAYALVPLYNVLCDVLGINGKTGGAVSATRVIKIDKSRQVSVEFIATNNAGLPWSFYPETKKVRLHPGETIHVAYFAKNNTGRTMTVQAVPSVTPGLASKYLKKTECFCFTQQTLAGHQSRDMPLIFYVDPALPKSVRTLTLSYTLFDASGITQASD